MRHAPFLLLLCACTSLSSEQQTALAGHQRNAALFYEGGRFGQAMGQIERGLELEPDDYKLNAMKGGILLQLSGDSQGTDHKRLDEATELLARVFDERSPDRHERFLLFDYARALQKQGRRHLGEAVRLEGQASRAPQPEELQQQARRERETAQRDLLKARELLLVLVERGETLRLAHSHLMQIAQDLGDDAAFAVAADEYLKQAKKDQAATEKDVQTTQAAAYEQQQLQMLRALRNEEIEVRTLMAEHFYLRKDYDSALVHLDRVLQLDPQRSVDYYNRGRVLLELRRADDAKADFRKFLATTTLPATSDKAALALKALDQ